MVALSPKRPITRRLIPGSRLLVYEGAPHGLVITHADRVNKDLASFIRENG